MKKTTGNKNFETTKKSSKNPEKRKFIILKNNILYELYNKKAPQLLISKLSKIKKQKELDVFIKFNSINLKNTTESKSIKIKKTNSFLEYKNRLLKSFKELNVHYSHLRLIKSINDKKEIIEYLRNNLSNQITPKISKSINQIKKIKSVKKKVKQKNTWTTILYTPMGNKR